MVRHEPQQSERKRALGIARTRMRDSSPATIARNASVAYHREGAESGRFEVPFLDHILYVTYPDGVVTASDPSLSAGHAVCLLLLHYLASADGHALTGRWIAFRELPDGLIYSAAFRRRVEPPLLSAFADNLPLFLKSGETLGGDPLDFGDASCVFSVLPRVRMAMVLHRGDEEFPPAARVLFDAVVGHYLPTEDLAVLGGIVVSSLLRISSQRCERV